MIKYSTELIVQVLKEVKATSDVNTVARDHGVNPAIVYNWAKKVGIVLPRRTNKRDWETIKVSLG